MKKSTVSLAVLILLIVMILGTIPKIQRIHSSDMILAADPYFNIAMANTIIQQGDYPTTLPWTIENAKNGHPPLFFVLVSIVSLQLGIDDYLIVKYFGVFISILILLSFFIFVKKLTNLTVALLSSFAFFSIPLLISRTILGLWENLSIFFIITSIYFLVDYKNKTNIIFFMFFLVSAMFTHHSGYYLLAFSFLYFAYITFFKERKTKYTLLFLPLLLSTLIISFFLLDIRSIVVNPFTFYFSSFTLVDLPTIHGYMATSLILFFTSIIILFAVLGFVKSLKWSDFKFGLGFITLWSLFFILLVALSFFSKDYKLNERFLIFLSIPLSVFFGVFLAEFSKVNIKLMLFISLLVFLVLIPFSYNWGWYQLYSKHDLDGVKFVNSFGDNLVVVIQPELKYLTIANTESKVYVGDEKREVYLIDSNCSNIDMWVDNNNQNFSHILLAYSYNINEINTLWGVFKDHSKVLNRDSNIDCLKKEHKLLYDKDGFLILELYKTDEIKI